MKENYKENGWRKRKLKRRRGMRKWRRWWRGGGNWKEVRRKVEIKGLAVEEEEEEEVEKRRIGSRREERRGGITEER